MEIPFTQLNAKLEKDLNQIIKTALSEVDPYKSVKKRVESSYGKLIICGKTFDLEDYGNVYLIGTGKAVIPMAAAVMDTAGDVIDDGVVITKHALDDYTIPEKIRVLKGGHPVPSFHSVESTKQLVDLVVSTKENDLIINLISGGGSALMTKPAAGITLDDLQALTSALLKCSATIQEINTIRKHIDEVKGGGLARFAGNTAMVSLIISDVLGDDISMIASGPTCADETTYQDAMDIIATYSIQDKIPQRILAHIKKGVKQDIEETLKNDDPINISKIHHVIGSLAECVRTAAETSKKLGYNTQVISTNIIGEAREIGKMCGSMLKTLATTDLMLPRPAILIGGGETTVKLMGSGKGGRNQEIAFGAMDVIAGCENCALIALATDGEDGPTDAAGAYITGYTRKRAANEGISSAVFGNNNDTYHFFKNMGNLVVCGPTGTNVNDLVLMIAY